jgi:hypothetical protein
MANRSYLYASDLVPARDIEKAKRRIVGISEWNYDIPVAYKLLASGAPEACISSIWKFDGKIAIVSDYEAGVRRLFEYLDRIPKSLIGSHRDEAHVFLSAPENKRRHFVLECGEIFQMQGSDLVQQNQQLLDEIEGFDPPVPRYDEEIERLGLGNWSNILYFAPREG